MKTIMWIILLVGLLILGIFGYEKFFGEDTRVQVVNTKRPAAAAKAASKAAARPRPPASKGTVTGIYSGSKRKIKSIYTMRDAALEKAALDK